MFILDSHCDTPTKILRLRDMTLDNEYAHVDFPKLKRGGVDGAFFALYIPAKYDSDYSAAYVYAHSLLKAVNDTINQNSHLACVTTNVAHAYENQSKNKFSVFLGLENGSPIGESFDNLYAFYRSGVRYVTLCHSGNNQICDSCATSVKTWGGLSPFGKELVAEMNRIGMLIDVSHVSDDTFYDVVRLSSRPIVATHSCCRALASHPRNMTDDMIRALAQNGGVIQINFYPVFLDDRFASMLSSSDIVDRGEHVENEHISNPSDAEKRQAWHGILEELKALPRPSYRQIVDHIDHVVSLTGIEHVGIGSDFDGIEVTPDGMEDISMMYKVFDEMRRRGYSEDDIEKVAGGNFFRVMNAVTSSGA